MNDILTELRGRDDPLAVAAAAEIRSLRSTNRRLHRRVQAHEGPMAREVAQLRMRVDSLRSVLDATRRSSDAAWDHVRCHSAALDEALLLAADREDENPGVGFAEVAEVVGRSIGRLYPGGQPTERIVVWKRRQREIFGARPTPSATGEEAGP